MFAGYSQQDSQELLRFLLDGLQEDTNRNHVPGESPYDPPLPCTGLAYWNRAGRVGGRVVCTRCSWGVRFLIVRCLIM